MIDIDVISFGIGAVSVSVPASIALVALSARLSRVRTPKPPPLLCSCGHGYGTHEGGARCHGQEERPHYMPHGPRNGYEYALCPCRLYDGPEPLPRTWSPDELAGGTP